MPSLALAVPIAIPLVASGLFTAFGLAGTNLGRLGAGAAAWGTVLSVAAIWVSVRATQELSLGPLGFGSNLDLRVDGVGFAFALIIGVPSAILLTLQPRAWQEATLATLGLAAAMAAVESGGVVLTALAGGTAATLALVHLDAEDPRARRPRWSVMLAAWLALSWAGVILQDRAGTAVYAAVPVASLTVPVFALLAGAALAASGLFPWRSWPAQVWARPSLRAAGIAVATVYPLGFYLLVRAFEMGDGRYPPALGAILATIGVAVALGAAFRAQLAANRREFLGEVVPGFGGFALASVAIGTPLGVVAALVTLATASAMIACLSLLPDRAGFASLLAIAAAVGLPPGFAFGARVLGIESAFEGGDSVGLIGLAGAAVWAVWMVAGARAIGLPAGRGHATAETFPRVAAGIALVTLVGGPGLAAFQAVFANPAQAEVMTTNASAVAGGATSVVTVSTVLPALTLFIPLVVVGVLAYGLAGTALVRGQARPALFNVPGAAAAAAAREAIRASTVPEQYRSILSLRGLEKAATGGHPALWIATLAALVFAVTR